MEVSKQEIQQWKKLNQNSQDNDEKCLAGLQRNG